jgi:hypothetical protein
MSKTIKIILAENSYEFLITDKSSIKKDLTDLLENLSNFPYAKLKVFINNELQTDHNLLEKIFTKEVLLTFLKPNLYITSYDFIKFLKTYLNQLAFNFLQATYQSFLSCEFTDKDNLKLQQAIFEILLQHDDLTDAFIDLYYPKYLSSRKTQQGPLKIKLRNLSEATLLKLINEMNLNELDDVILRSKEIDLSIFWRVYYNNIKNKSYHPKIFNVLYANKILSYEKLLELFYSFLSKKQNYDYYNIYQDRLHEHWNFLKDQSFTEEHATRIFDCFAGSEPIYYVYEALILNNKISHTFILNNLVDHNQQPRLLLIFDKFANNPNFDETFYHHPLILNYLDENCTSCSETYWYIFCTKAKITIKTLRLYKNYLFYKHDSNTIAQYLANNQFFPLDDLIEFFKEALKSEFLKEETLMENLLYNVNLPFSQVKALFSKIWKEKEVQDLVKISKYLIVFIKNLNIPIDYLFTYLIELYSLDETILGKINNELNFIFINLLERTDIDPKSIQNFYDTIKANFFKITGANIPLWYYLFTHTTPLNLKVVLKDFYGLDAFEKLTRYDSSNHLFNNPNLLPNLYFEQNFLEKILPLPHLQSYQEYSPWNFDAQKVSKYQDLIKYLIKDDRNVNLQIAQVHCANLARRNRSEVIKETAEIFLIDDIVKELCEY